MKSLSKSLAQRTAFSLVELSIVLVILGLLTGGILSGQSLIRAAELRSVTSDYSRYIAAVRTFRDKYFSVPGDMSNAASFWGTSTGGCPGTSTTPSTTAGTCNGDGNGQLSPSVTTSNENYRFWQHLANAALIEGSFSGVTANTGGASSIGSTIGTNVPRSRIANVGWHAVYLGTIATSDTTYFENSYDHVLQFGSGTTTTATVGAVIKPEEAWNIDTKLDDGKPGTGLVTSLESQGSTTSTGCSDTAASASAIANSSAYALGNTGTNCSLQFKMGF